MTDLQKIYDQFSPCIRRMFVRYWFEQALAGNQDKLAGAEEGQDPTTVYYAEAEFAGTDFGEILDQIYRSETIELTETLAEKYAYTAFLGFVNTSVHNGSGMAMEDTLTFLTGEIEETSQSQKVRDQYVVLMMQAITLVWLKKRPDLISDN